MSKALEKSIAAKKTTEPRNMSRGEGQARQEKGGEEEERIADKRTRSGSQVFISRICVANNRGEARPNGNQQKWGKARTRAGRFVTNNIRKGEVVGQRGFTTTDRPPRKEKKD